ncbi:MAG: acetolactate synthase small subunit [Alphaproteobacteria bacterium GM202ARS2]|nr:acetolactate synthase small subunit [Alphaproteobacteria bacterium GM202ARS2]
MYDNEKIHILTILVDNEPGVLARVIGLFSGRGYNIESLTVSEVDGKRHLSRITITTKGAQTIIDQIMALLGRLVPVHHVVDLVHHMPFIARDSVLAKVICPLDKQKELCDHASSFGAQLADKKGDVMIFTMTDEPERIDSFIKSLRNQGSGQRDIDVCRAGIFALDYEEQALQKRKHEADVAPLALTSS